MELLNLSNYGAKIHQIRKYAEFGTTWWSAFNPSIQSDHNGDLWVAFRSSNYYFTDDYGTGLTVGNKVKNRIFIGRLDPITLLFDSATLKEVDMEAINSDIVRGLEDPRLYYDGHSWCLSTTILEAFVPIAKMCVVRLKSLEDPQIASMEILLNLDPDRVEKNWMPIHKADYPSKYDFMYDASTLTSNNKFILLPQNKKTKGFRGGSQILPLSADTSIAVIHEVFEELVPTKRLTVTFTTTKRVRVYTHRFILLDSELNITHASDKFFFLGKGIEFASGIAAHGDNFIVSFGRLDASSHLAVIGKQEVFDLLKNLSSDHISNN